MNLSDYILVIVGMGVGIFMLKRAYDIAVLERELFAIIPALAGIFTIYITCGLLYLTGQSNIGKAAGIRKLEPKQAYEILYVDWSQNMLVRDLDGNSLFIQPKTGDPSEQVAVGIFDSKPGTLIYRTESKDGSSSKLEILLVKNGSPEQTN